MRPATQEEIELLRKFLLDNKLKVAGEAITTYPNGIAHTQVAVNVYKHEDTENTKSNGRTNKKTKRVC